MECLLTCVKGTGLNSTPSPSARHASAQSQRSACWDSVLVTHAGARQCTLSLSTDIPSCVLPRLLCRGLEQQLADVHTQMADLRTKLYARLGDSINLDVPHSAVAGKA